MTASDTEFLACDLFQSHVRARQIIPLADAEMRKARFFDKNCYTNTYTFRNVHKYRKTCAKTDSCVLFCRSASARKSTSVHAYPHHRHRCRWQHLNCTQIGRFSRISRGNNNIHVRNTEKGLATHLLAANVTRIPFNAIARHAKLKRHDDEEKYDTRL